MLLPADPPARRPRCALCLRPASACICAAARCAHSAVQVLILMHPLEQHHAKGTARLAHLCLPHSRMLVGETFAPELLTQPWSDADQAAPRRALLLYPATPHEPSHPLPQPPELPAAWLAEPARLRLVVLDGTWRHSRQLLRAHPALQALPRLALHGAPPSRYAIRKAHAPQQRSTLEAIEGALRQLDPANAGAADALGEAMHALMTLQAPRWPAAMLREI